MLLHSIVFASRCARVQAEVDAAEEPLPGEAVPTADRRAGGSH